LEGVGAMIRVCSVGYSTWIGSDWGRIEKTGGRDG
ncbi:MAG: hypothetical protein RL215_2489, partial [Planctomycetota bacterium]|jgi:hypothetical protein